MAAVRGRMTAIRKLPRSTITLTSLAVHAPRRRRQHWAVLHGYDSGLFVCAAARSLARRRTNALSSDMTAWLWPARL
jgi:hypothetical protein